MRSTVAITLTLVLFSLSVVHADTINIPTDYPTIQEGIDAASNGDTVLVAPGTYKENIDFLGKAISLVSEEGPKTTVIDGRRAGSVVTFRDEKDGPATIEGFTIRNGTGTILNSSDGPNFYGGGIFCEEASPWIENNIITHNLGITAPIGQAVYGAGIYCQHSSAVITGNEISRNSATNWTPGYVGGSGGGIHTSASDLTIRGNFIHHNMAGYYGGAIRGYFSDDLIIEDNIILENRASKGGGIYCFDCSGHSTIANNIIVGNRATKIAFDGCGGGLFLSQSFMSVTGNLIANNVSDFEAGGIYCSWGSIKNNIIAGNFAEVGGGLYCAISGNYHANNTVTGNYARCKGSGLYIFEYGGPKIRNCIIHGNIHPGHEPDIFTDGGIPDIAYCNVKGGWPGTGNIDANPMFVDPAIWDFHLRYTSPCRDTGDNTAATDLYDFEGDPRIGWDETVDMGADEFYTHLYCTGEAIPGQGVDVKLIGQPTNDAMLFIGTDIRIEAIPTVHGNWWLVPPCLIFDLGQMPWTGVLSLQKRIPPDCPVPFTFPAQGMVRGRLSNLCVLEIK